MLSALLTSIFSGEAVLAIRRTRIALIAYALIGFCVLCAAGFLLAAAFIYISAIYGTLETSIGFAVGFLVLAGLIWLGFRIGARARAKRRAKRHRGEIASIVTATALAALPALVKGRNPVGLIGLPLAAFVAWQIFRENASRSPEDESELDD